MKKIIIFPAALLRITTIFHELTLNLVTEFLITEDRCHLGCEAM
jgi:hypothetical protein